MENINFRDKNHKPECICALSSFRAVHGIRNIPEILAKINKYCPVGLAAEQDLLKKSGFRRFNEILHCF